MDMNQFRNYLSDITNSLHAPQKGLSPIMENRKLAGKSKAGKAAANALYQEEGFSHEDIVLEYLNAFFDGNLTESTSDEDVMGAVDTINIICEELTSYFLSEEDIEPSDLVTESLDALFGDSLHEDTTSDEDIIAVLEGLNAVTTIVNEYFTQD